jgi:hypothetical protein
VVRYGLMGLWLRLCSAWCGMGGVGWGFGVGWGGVGMGWGDGGFLSLCTNKDSKICQCVNLMFGHFFARNGVGWGGVGWGWGGGGGGGGVGMGRWWLPFAVHKQRFQDMPTREFNVWTFFCKKL